MRAFLVAAAVLIAKAVKVPLKEQGRYSCEDGCVKGKLVHTKQLFSTIGAFHSYSKHIDQNFLLLKTEKPF